MVEGYQTARFDNVQASAKAIEEMENADLEWQILLLLHFCICVLCGIVATPVSSIFANVPVGMAFFSIFVAAQNFCSIARYEY